MATEVRLVTAATILSGFVLLSVFLAATHVEAESPVPQSSEGPGKVIQKAELPQPKVAEPIDVKQFRMILSYHGISDKPYYNLTLSVPPLSHPQDSFALLEYIDAKQAAKVFEHLTTSGFFKHARVTDNQNDPDTGPQYLLRVRHGDKHYEETLGWNVGTLLRLRGLRKTLEGDAGKLMDQLLGRLEGFRKIWESGDVSGDLKTTLSIEQKSFAAGRPILIKLEATNVANRDHAYGHHRFILSGSEFMVFDEYGRQVQYLGGGAGLSQHDVPLKSRETKVIEACDLSSYYYLRRPGRYTVSFHGSIGGLHSTRLPVSNSLSFQVTADASATLDGDPLGLLLKLVSTKFTLIGNPNGTSVLRPGGNRSEVPGRQFIFADPVKGLKTGKASVWVWLTDEAAKEVAPPDGSYLPLSEELGNVSRWQVYVHVSPEALKIWPTVREDLKDVLNGQEPKNRNQPHPTE